jgi:hypothetical protein
MDDHRIGFVLTGWQTGVGHSEAQKKQTSLKLQSNANVYNALRRRLLVQNWIDDD